MNIKEDFCMYFIIYSNLVFKLIFLFNYTKMAEFFCNKGLDVHLIDLRGFGYSGGPRGFASFSELLSDIGSLIS